MSLRIHKILRIATRFHQSKTCEKELEGTGCKKCKGGVCNNPVIKSRKRSEGGGLLSSWFENPTPEPKPLKAECQIEQMKKECQAAPAELKQFDGKPYKTGGADAYIIQKPKANFDAKAVLAEEEAKEKLILKEIAAPEELKDKQQDPMPEFTTVVQRMIDLDQRKLHPLYKKYMTTPRKIMYNVLKTTEEYKPASGPIKTEEYIKYLKIKKELMETKNMYSEYKSILPSQQLLAKPREIALNARPTLERKLKKSNIIKKNVYDTLRKYDSMAKQTQKK